MTQQQEQFGADTDATSLAGRESSRSLTAIIFSKFIQSKLAVTGAIFLLLIIAVVVFAPYLVPHDPAQQDLPNRLAPPNKENWLGTDHLGRDLFTRLLYGGRFSLLVAFIAISISIVIGTTVGALAGFFGGKVDAVLMRLVDIIISFPFIILLILLVSLLNPSITVIISVLGAVGWTGIARLVRGEFLTLKSREFVLSAQTIGMSKARIIFSEILPNAVGPIIVAATLGIGSLIIAESTLSFLGLGIQQPIPTWGNMLNDAQSVTIFRKAWWFPTMPGVMILLTVLSFNFVGDGLRDAFDPRTVER